MNKTPAPSPTSSRGRHRSKGALSLRLAAPVGTALAGALVVVAVGANLSGDDGSTGGPGGGVDCAASTSTIQVAAAPEIAPVVAEVVRIQAEASGSSSCEQVLVTARSAAAVAAGLRVPKQARPDVWIPDSSIWIGRAPGRPPLPAAPDPTVATSPVVLALPGATAEQLGWPGRTIDFDRLAAEGDRAPRVRFAALDPRESATAVGALVGLRRAVADQADARAAFTATLRAAVPAESVEPMAALQALPRSAEPLAVAASEQAVYAYNRTARSQSPVVAAYPQGSAGALDYPVLVMEPGRPVAEAAARLLAGLQSKGGQALVQSQGFRKIDGTAGTALALESGVDWRVKVGASRPDRRDVQVILQTFATITRPSRILAVVDVSGSMGDIVPGSGGATRMDLTRAAAAGSLSLFPEDTLLGLWEFSTDLTPTTDYRQILPIGPASGPAREALAVAVAGLREIPDGNTGLYDTALAAVREVRSNWDPARVNSVILLTDGRNDDDQGISLDKLLATLERENDPQRPVPVVAVVFGPDGDADALGAISEVTGGSTYVARDPRQIRQVFLDAISRRSCGAGC